MFKLEFETDNAAFDNLEAATNNTLREIAGYIIAGYTEGIVRDSNGNKIGSYALTQQVQAELGATSSDSCKMDDIVAGVADLLPEKLLREFEASEPVDPEDDALQMSIFEEICEYLDEIAPEGAHFGTQEGDGVCYGFWKDEDEDEETDEEA